MNADFWSAIGSSWQLAPGVLLALIVSGTIYIRGWRTLRERGSTRFPVWRLVCFLAALLSISLALQSPIDSLASFSLQIHMVQHLLLMLVTPPLVWLAAPELPMLAGMPKWFRDEWIRPFARTRQLRTALDWLFRPQVALVLYTATLWIWHAPGCYQLALESEFWHRVEHAMFLAASLLFWHPVIQPFPHRTTYSRWLLIPYLFLAGVQGTILSGILCFSPRVLYPHYDAAPNLWHISPLDDQSLAGALMWIPTSLAYVAALFWIVAEQMSSNHATARRQVRPRPIAVPRRSDKPTGPQPSLWASLLQPRAVRVTLRWTMFALAAIVILDGLTGPQISPLNLAGVAPWIHWRAILVITLIVGGNFFCAVCPFTALRGLARRFRLNYTFPKWLQNKWPAVALLAIFFWAYEAFSLWDRPAWTAAIILGFFVVALAFDLLFAQAPFCKYVCPIGQFNFVQSLVSPSQVAARSTDVCAGCRTRDCLAGSANSPGCQLSLFVPKKQGNLDCTFCLDCADACPHQNITIVPLRIGSDLVIDPQRSGVGSYSQRTDLAALIVVLFFAALLNAAWMTVPLVGVEESLTTWLGWGRLPTVTVGMLLGLLALPWLLMQAVGKATSPDVSWRANVMRFAPALIPLGLGMWTAHYTFHFFTSADSLLWATERMANDRLATEFLIGGGECSCCTASSVAWLLPLELLLLDIGLCLSLWAAYRIAQRIAPQLVLRTFAPWGIFLVLFFLACVWVLLQPMEMRGAYVAGL
ncbi:cytochrome c oxidase assembly protein [Blastopirellula retiformator]|uniref:Putative electron transport protein YccM n=1 Tax=Blastopirellula retiformator TaxID=2527970 RepID=A0A5C5VL12_9BACT|nr:cytochrome c oxidase assembly protein [Blastopirellula retiformator]TWT38713.1 putative electron transport protein YccM [Blastopirellula retiformator]